MTLSPSRRGVFPPPSHATEPQNPTQDQSSWLQRGALRGLRGRRPHIFPHMAAPSTVQPLRLPSLFLSLLWSVYSPSQQGERCLCLSVRSFHKTEPQEL